MTLDQWTAMLEAVRRGEPLTIFGQRYVPQDEPRPRSLREQVARAWCSEYYGHGSGSAKDPAPDQLDAADAVLAVVADALRSLPQIGIGDGSGQKFAYRCDDVDRLLRGTP